MSQQFPGEMWFALSKSMQRNLCRGRSRVRKLAVEKLEDRQLMAADVAVDVEQPIEPAIVELPGLACIDVAPGSPFTNCVVTPSYSSFEPKDFENLEPIQLPEQDWGYNRSLTP